MHAYRAIEAGDADTVAIVYGNNQLSACGRTLGTGGGGGGVGHDAGADGVRVPDGHHARRCLRDGRAAPHARVRHDAGAARVDRGAGPRARGPQPARDVPRPDHRRRRARLQARRRSAAQARLLRHLRRWLLHHPHHRGARPRPAHRPVYVRGAAGRHDAPLDPGDGRHDHAPAAAVSGPKAFAEAGITPADVDMFQMYDSFTYTVLVVLEDLGFAPKGEGGAFVPPTAATCASAARCRRTPMAAGSRRTHPGMRGLFLLCEATRQLRGEAGDCRLPARRSRSRTAVAVGCRRRAPWCSARSEVRDGRLVG